LPSISNTRINTTKSEHNHNRNLNHNSHPQILKQSHQHISLQQSTTNTNSNSTKQLHFSNNNVQHKINPPTQHISKLPKNSTHPHKQPTNMHINQITNNQRHPIKTQQQPSEPVPIVAEQSVTADLIPRLTGSNPIPSNIFPTSDFFSNNISNSLIKTSTNNDISTLPR